MSGLSELWMVLTGVGSFTATDCTKIAWDRELSGEYGLQVSVASGMRYAGRETRVRVLQAQR